MSHWYTAYIEQTQGIETMITILFFAGVLTMGIWYALPKLRMERHQSIYAIAVYLVLATLVMVAGSAA